MDNKENLEKMVTQAAYPVHFLRAIPFWSFSWVDSSSFYDN